jgi:hypothetical protein
MSQIQERATEITEYTEKFVVILVLACQLSSLHQRLRRQLAIRIRVITFSVLSVLSVFSVANRILS